MNAHDPAMLTNAEHMDVFGEPSTFAKKQNGEQAKEVKEKRKTKRKIRESYDQLTEDEKMELVAMLMEKYE